MRYSSLNTTLASALNVSILLKFQQSIKVTFRERERQSTWHASKLSGPLQNCRPEEFASRDPSCISWLTVSFSLGILTFSTAALDPHPIETQ